MAGDATPTAGSEPRPTWWSRRSLRARLTAATTLVLAVGLALAALLLVWRVQASLLAGLDAATSQQAQSVAAGAEHAPLPQTLPDAGDGAPLVQVVSSDGRVLAASDDAKGASRMFSLHGDDHPVLATRALAHGDDGATGSYRVAAVTASTSSGRVTVYAALPTAPVSESVAELTGTLAVGVPILVIALAAVAWLLVGRALRPVELLRRQAADIPASDLERRLRLPAPRDELGRLAGTLNDLLGRIQAATDRQRQFVADAAHELRSPIASLRAQLELAARHPESHHADPQEMLAEAERLSRLADDLLALARMDASPQRRRQTVDLDDIVLAQAHAARGRGLRLDVSAVSPGQVVGDPGALTRMVRNLLANAVRHARGSVAVSLGRDGTSVMLVVADDGAGIAPQDRQRVFERFTRLDDARTRDAGGAGLGLAIVYEVVRGLGGEVSVGDNRPGARFTVRLPAAP